MGRPSRFSPEVRERAVRMVFEHAPEYPWQWAEIRFRTAGTIETDVSFRGELLHHSAPAPERVPVARDRR